jgi:hypothetical protein
MVNCNYAAFKILRQTDAVVTTSTTMFPFRPHRKYESYFRIVCIKRLSMKNGIVEDEEKPRF